MPDGGADQTEKALAKGLRFLRFIVCHSEGFFRKRESPPGRRIVMRTSAKVRAPKSTVTKARVLTLILLLCSPLDWAQDWIASTKCRGGAGSCLRP